MGGDHLIDRNGRADDGALLDRRTREQATRLSRVNALARRLFVEETFDDVDLLFDGLKNRQSLAQLHIGSGAGGAPVVFVDAVAEEQNAEALRKLGGGGERRHGLQERQRHRHARAAKNGSARDA